jgi:hypothetical protein
MNARTNRWWTVTLALACAAWVPAQELAPRYMVDVERYQFGAPNLGDPNFYPIPQEPITRDHYRRAIEALDPKAIAENPERGMGGPRAFMPVLVRYVHTGEKQWGEACVRMLQAFHSELLKQINERKWFWQFEDPAALIPLYRKHLITGGAMAPDAAWFHEMWLCYCRNLHVWDSEPVEWRGGCHRSMPEGLAKGLAAKWYPDIPESADWKRYSDLVFRDFWRSKDVPQNDTGYMMGPLIILTCGGDQWTGDDRVYTGPEMQWLWDRLIVEVTPDGAVNPYGPNGGWNSTADYRLAMLERLAAKTGDGRYAWVAKKLFQYLAYQDPSGDAALPKLDHGNAWLICLAWLFADERVEPAQPSNGSLWTKRAEAIRVPHTDKSLTELLLGDADPRENHGHICCSWFLTDKVWPDKLVLRSGWNSGDFFGVVELHPTSFPANPGGIMGLNRWGAAFTQIVTSKGASTENRLLIEDRSGKAAPRYHPDKKRINEFWKSGEMPDIQSEVTFFKDTLEATYASVKVQNMNGLPVTYERAFVFVKNGFLVTREIVTFEESFPARVGPLWNTQNIGPQVGDHWANTFISAPVGDNGRRSCPTPPVDLLVWFAPKASCQLQAIDRFAQDPRTVACPNQLRYTWTGDAEQGQRLHFTQVYYPHMPYRPLPSSNNPNPDMKAAYRNALEASAGASGIQVLQDETTLTILRFEFEPGIVSWVAFNPIGQSVKIGNAETSAVMHYQTGS